MDPFFVIVIVPSVNADVYKVIKKNLVVENAIPNQVITGQKCLKKDPKTGGLKMAVVTKVAVQIACKVIHLILSNLLALFYIIITIQE